MLGLVKAGPLHGYQIRKKIREGFGYFTGFTPQSVYYALKNLAKKQYLTKAREKVGARPEREIYRITEKGEKEFSRLMDKNLDNLYRPFFNVDFALFFLNYLDRSRVKEKIARQERTLRGIRVWARKGEKMRDFPYSLIFRHMEKAVSCEIDFLKDLAKSL